MGRRLARAVELAAALDGTGLPATTDVRDLAGLLGEHPAAVLVPPPTVEPSTYASDAVTWRLVLLAASSVGDAAAWSALDDGLDLLAAVLAFERADPTSYAVSDGERHPAYIVTVPEEC